MTLLHETLVLRAKAAPERPAVFDGDIVMSYRELCESARRLAGQMIKAGAAPGKRIGIAAREPSDRVVAMYGAMFAGNAWVPIDPDYPAQRVAFILNDAGVDHVLVSAGQDNVQLPTSAVELVIDRSGAHEEAAFTHQCGPDDEAYVIYTSGSTGQPKGVIVAHRAVAATIAGMAAAYNLSAEDRMLQFASFGFDASIAEIGAAIHVGAALVVADRITLTPSQAMAEFMEAAGVTAATFPPSTLAAMPSPAAGRDWLPSLTTLICAGEALPVSLARQWFEGRTIYNAYGPTETAICATVTRISRMDLQRNVLP